MRLQEGDRASKGPAAGQAELEDHMPGDQWNQADLSREPQQLKYIDSLTTQNEMNHRWCLFHLATALRSLRDKESQVSKEHAKFYKAIPQKPAKIPHF